MADSKWTVNLSTSRGLVLSSQNSHSLQGLSLNLFEVELNKNQLNVYGTIERCRACASESSMRSVASSVRDVSKRHCATGEGNVQIVSWKQQQVVIICACVIANVPCADERKTLFLITSISIGEYFVP